MPFNSLLQAKACFATNGFNGKVNCKEWASHTDYSNLPKKKSGNDILKAKKVKTVK